jgi:hypothetical protein
MEGIEIKKKNIEAKLLKSSYNPLAIQLMSYSVWRLSNMVQTLSFFRPKKGFSFTPIRGVLQYGYNPRLGYTHLEVWLSQYTSLLPTTPSTFFYREDLPFMVFCIGLFCLLTKVKKQRD